MISFSALDWADDEYLYDKLVLKPLDQLQEHRNRTCIFLSFRLWDLQYHFGMRTLLKEWLFYKIKRLVNTDGISITVLMIAAIGFAVPVNAQNPAGMYYH